MKNKMKNTLYDFARFFKVNDIIKVRKTCPADGSESSFNWYKDTLSGSVKVRRTDECCAFPSLHLVNVDGSTIDNKHIQREQGCIPERYFVLVSRKKEE